MVDGLHRVVITGLGAVTPIGNTVQDYWNGLTSGSNGVDAITLFDASAHACRFAAEVKDFDPSGFIEPKEAKRWDRFCKFGVVAAKQAVAHAGLEINDANADRIGTIIGSGVGGLLHRCRDVGDVDGGISKSTGAAPSVAIGVVGCLGRLEDLEHRLTVVEAVHRALWELEYAIEREAEERGLFDTPTFFIEGQMFMGRAHIPLMRRLLADGGDR